jgi:hypothetical protein
MTDSQASDWSARRDQVGQRLVRQGAAITPGWAIHTGDLDRLRIFHEEFVAAGGGPSSRPPLLSMAVASRRTDVVEFLLDLGYDPDERRRLDHVEDDIETWGEPLREAVLLGETAIARMLLERGATPQTGVYAASTAMYEAHARGNAEMVQLLERHGGIPTLSDMAYLGLTDRAIQSLQEQAGINEAGRAPGASDVLQGAADTGNVDLVRAALAHIDWPEGDPRWHWMLMRVLGQHAAADRSKYEGCLRAMLERSGADVRGPYGRTLLHDVAATWPRSAPMESHDSLGFATLLLDFGARLDVREQLLQSTPLGWACRWGRVALVRLLLDRGADPVEPDAEPWATPRAWAVKNGDPRILAMLAAC